MIQALNMKKIIVSLIAGMVMAFGLTAAVSPNPVSAASEFKGELCSGADLSLAGSGNCNTGGPENTLNATIRNAINIFSVIVGIVAVVMIIIGGFNFITSGGDSGKISTAKNTVIYALVGLVIVALAQAIVRFVLNATD